MRLKMNKKQKMAYQGMKQRAEYVSGMDNQPMINLANIEKADTSEIEEVILGHWEKGEPVSHKWLLEYRKENTFQFRAFVLKHAVYGFPTDLAINKIKPLIEGKEAVEIGAGDGWFSKILGIPGVDTYQQRDQVFKDYYHKVLGQPVIQYRNDHVIQVEAMEYIKRKKPEVVFGSYISDYEVGEVPVSSCHSPFGIKDWEMFNHGVQTYIFIGSKQTHHDKRVLTEKGLKVQYIHDMSITRSEESFIAIISKKR